MKLLQNSNVIVESNDWAELVRRAEEEIVERTGDWPAITLKRAAPWWIADINRTEKELVTIDDLCNRAARGGCPFSGIDFPEKYDSFYEVAGGFWQWCMGSFSAKGIIQAIRKAAEEPIRTPKQLAHLYAEDCGYTVEDKERN